MGYAEVYRKRMNPWRRALRVLVYVIIVGMLFYFSIQMLGTQSGLMMGGTIGK